MTASAADPDAPLALTLDIEQTSPMPLKGQLRCEAGQMTALVGPSGAGKTSMLRVMAGLMRPQRGRLQIDGDTWLDTERGICWSPQRRRVGLVFQHYALMPHLSALDNVALAIADGDRAQRRQQAARWLERVRLAGEVVSRRPAGLSGGQRQRVAVARALAREPRLLLLDEPFSAVDQMNRRSLYQLLADLRRELTMPIVLVTHDLHEARMLADRLAVIDAGEVLQQGTPQFIHRAPRNARVADLVGILNRFDGIWEGPADGRPGVGGLRWKCGTDGQSARWPLLPVRDKGRIKAGQAVSWVIPGDGLALLERPPREAGEFDALIVEARHLGDSTLASVALRDWPAVTLQLTLSGPMLRVIEDGARTTLALDLSMVHVMPLQSSPVARPLGPTAG